MYQEKKYLLRRLLRERFVPQGDKPEILLTVSQGINDYDFSP